MRWLGASRNPLLSEAVIPTAAAKTPATIGPFGPVLQTREGVQATIGRHPRRSRVSHCESTRSFSSNRLPFWRVKDRCRSSGEDKTFVCGRQGSVRTLTDVRRPAATSLDDSQASCAPRHGRREVGLGMLRRQMARRPPRSGGPTEKDVLVAGAGAPAPHKEEQNSDSFVPNAGPIAPALLKHFYLVSPRGGDSCDRAKRGGNPERSDVPVIPSEARNLLFVGLTRQRTDVKDRFLGPAALGMTLTAQAFEYTPPCHSERSEESNFPTTHPSKFRNQQIPRPFGARDDGPNPTNGPARGSALTRPHKALSTAVVLF
ncbi:MAG: hypothetical protein KatS3mg007_1498 [Thermoanaerobaculum sp.]|nr:MAG: hypothetical protein KatS3mg007_1498 [Thermoanaerobaculum sp.]